MTHYGNIQSYDRDAGSGTISQPKGGDALPFVKADLEQQGHVPEIDQRYSYETSEVDGGNKKAVNLKQLGESARKEEQARAQQG